MALNFSLQAQATETVRPAAHSAKATGRVTFRNKTHYGERTFD